MHLSTIAFNSPGTRTHIPAHKFHDTLECTLLYTRPILALHSLQLVFSSTCRTSQGPGSSA